MAAAAAPNAPWPKTACNGRCNHVGATNGTKSGAHISVRHQTQKNRRSHRRAASNDSTGRLICVSTRERGSLTSVLLDCRCETRYVWSKTVVRPKADPLRCSPPPRCVESSRFCGRHAAAHSDRSGQQPRQTGDVNKRWRAANAEWRRKHERVYNSHASFMSTCI
jgi:hypothetical protein